MLEAFRIGYGESPYAEMRDLHGNRLLLLSNRQTRSWSLFVLPAANETVACLVASGMDFHPVEGRPGRSA